MPPSTIPSTSSATSSPGRRFGSSDQKRRRNGKARPPRHDDSPCPCSFRLERLNLTVPTQILDMLVVGGGINGVGIARDAAGRGLSVRLVEKGDLAAATSSASSQLIHGGLRYLEHGAFRLVREALAEREVLLASAPHIIQPLPFVLPYARG